MSFNNIITIGAAVAGAYYVANRGSKSAGGSSDKDQMNMGVLPLPMPTPTPAPSDPEPETTPGSNGKPEPPSDPTTRVEPDADAKFSAIAEHPTSEDIFGVKSSGDIEKVADTTEHGTGGGEADYFSKY